MSNIKLKRGRKPGSGVMRFKPVVSTMADFTYDKSLFTPMPTGKRVDSLFSSEGGLMKGTNYAFVGDPGVGKTTVLLDMMIRLIIINGISGRWRIRNGLWNKRGKTVYTNG